MKKWHNHLWKGGTNLAHCSVRAVCNVLVECGTSNVQGEGRHRKAVAKKMLKAHAPLR